MPAASHVFGTRRTVDEPPIVVGITAAPLVPRSRGLAKLDEPALAERLQRADAQLARTAGEPALRRPEQGERGLDAVEVAPALPGELEPRIEPAEQREADVLLQPIAPHLEPVALASVSDNVSDGYRAVAPHLADRASRGCAAWGEGARAPSPDHRHRALDDLRA
jgi:hypothetical protein